MKTINLNLSFVPAQTNRECPNGQKTGNWPFWCPSIRKFCSILQFARQKDCSDGNERKLKSQTEQSWIFSKTMRRRQLHNLFVFSLSEHVEIVCVALAEQFQLVGSICECLELLEQIGNDYLSSGLPALMEKCQKHLESALKLLEAFNDWKLEWIGGAMMAMGGWSQWDYLQDVPKTKALMQQFWGRFRTFINIFQTQISPIPSSSICSISQIANSQNHLLFASSQSLLTESSSAQQAQYNSTISSVYSTLEWSTLSAAFSTNSHLLTTHLDLIKTQMKRLLRSLLGELLTWSAGLARTQTLPRLQTALRRSMDPKLMGTFLLFREEIARTWAKGNPLKPAHLGLDMLAYHFSKMNGPPLYFNYYGDGQRELFDQLVEIFAPTMATNEDEPSSENEEIMVARTSEGQLILRLQSSTCSPMNESMASKSRKLLAKLPFGGLRKTKHSSMPNEGQKSSHQQPSYNAIILFSRFVNLTLAIKQAQKLIEILAEQMAQSQQCFR